MEFDWGSCLESTFEGKIDATKLWTGEPARDEHLRSPDFFYVEKYPTISFNGRFVDRTGDITFKAEADVTIRGKTHTVPMDVTYQGMWETPFWVGDENRGSMRRMGFEARTTVNRHDWDVSWQDELPGGGRVVGNEVVLVLDAELIDEADLEKTGAIEYYR
jgi:polyisoprenoid-binding protein YceI